MSDQPIETQAPDDVEDVLEDGDLDEEALAGDVADAAEEEPEGEAGPAALADGEDGEAEEAEEEPLDPRQLRMVEALIFASAEPVSERQLQNKLPEGAPIKRLCRALQLQYAEGGVNLMRAGKSWAFRTAPDLVGIFNKEMEVARKMSRAAVETLAIIAYHQPVTRAEIEEIRGVSLSKGTLDVLFEEGWIKPRGRKQSPGRPMMWGTTDAFLDHFGLETIRDLPGMAELKAAGLLDTRPAIEAYGVRGNMESLVKSEGEDALEGDAAPVTNRPSDDGEALVDEPLDPDDGLYDDEDVSENLGSA